MIFRIEFALVVHERSEIVARCITKFVPQLTSPVYNSLKPKAKLDLNAKFPLTRNIVVKHVSAKNNETGESSGDHKKVKKSLFVTEETS